MALEDVIAELVQEQRKTNRLLATLLAHTEDDRATLDRIAREQELLKALRVGTTLYGYCGGFFMGDYGDKVVSDVQAGHGGIRITVEDEDGRHCTENFESWEDAAFLVGHATMPKDDPRHPEHEQHLEEEREAWAKLSPTRRRPTPEERTAALREAGVPLPHDYDGGRPKRPPKLTTEERVAEARASL